MIHRGEAGAGEDKSRTERGRTLAMAKKGNPFHDCLSVEQTLRGTVSGDVDRRDELINCKLTYDPLWQRTIKLDSLAAIW